MAGVDDLGPEDRADDERRAGVDDRTRRRHIGHGAGAEQKPAGSVGASSRISPTAPGTVIVTSSARTPPSAIASTTARSFAGFSQPDHGDDAERFDLAP